MSNSSPFNFGNFVPGFDFLQNLTSAASKAQSPSATLPGLPDLSSWLAPTLNVDDVEKRIKELKTVMFWLEQNSKALSATIQALEVQKMTLATLESMNLQMDDIAKALQPKAAATSSTTSHTASSAASSATKKSPTATGLGVDPVQWWGALTQQFQHIANNALQDTAQNASAQNVGQVAADLTRDAIKAATDLANTATASATATANALAQQVQKAAPVSAKTKPASTTQSPATGAGKAKTAVKSSASKTVATGSKAAPASGAASKAAKTPTRKR